MADSPSDEAIPVHGTVGGLDALEEPPPVAQPDSVLRVSVSGDAMLNSGAMGLDEDLRLLVQAFIQRPASVDREKTRGRETQPSDEHEGIEIALHGLNLEPDAEAELRDLIREVVRDRLTQSETKK